jgi:hypothetical protein
MSTAFDGSAMLAASYAIRYAEKGLNGSMPRMAVRLFAIIAAYLQTFHARVTHEPQGAWIMWASLPVIAAILYEIHLRYAKREALLRAGSTYATPSPAFGPLAWVLFPKETMRGLKAIVERRRDAILSHAMNRTRIIAAVEPVKRPALPEDDHSANKTPGSHRDHPSGRRDAPVLHMRRWLQQNGHEIGDFGRIPADLQALYRNRAVNGS